MLIFQLLALIGDQFMDESSYVNGIWVNVRSKGDKLSLWTKNAKNADVQMKIGRKFREILGLKYNLLTYEVIFSNFQLNLFMAILVNIEIRNMTRITKKICQCTDAK